MFNKCLLHFACSVIEPGLGQSGAFKLVKEGFVLLQFAPAAGVRLYDWSRKQVFNITAVFFSFEREFGLPRCLIITKNYIPLC